MVPQRPPTCRPNTSQRAISTTVELTVHLPAPPGGSSSSSSSSSDGFFPRTFLRPHNVSHCRKLPRPRGACGVLAERQLAHLTGTRLAHQAAAAWSRLQARSWRRLAAGQPTAHSTTGAPSPGLQRGRARMGRDGHGAGIGYAGFAGTRRSSGPRLLQLYESLRPSSGQFRVARDFASAHRVKRDSLPRVSTGDGAASASKGGDEGCVAAQRFGSRPQHDPSFWTERFASDLNPRPFNDETAFAFARPSPLMKTTVL